MKILKEDIQFPDFRITNGLKAFLHLDEVKKAFKLSDIQKIYDMYIKYEKYTNSNNNITKLFFNLDINPLTYLTDIPDSAFYGIDLSPLIFNNQLKYIGYGSFSYNRVVKSISIPDSCEKIGSLAFANCPNLQEIHLGNNIQKLGEKCFEYDNKLTHIVLPENIEAINEFAFTRSWIRSITIPKSCGYFFNNIFQECKKLNYIYYKGTYDEFKAINKSKRWRSSIYSSFPVWVKCTNGRFDIYNF